MKYFVFRSARSASGACASGPRRTVTAIAVGAAMILSLPAAAEAEVEAEAHTAARQGRVVLRGQALHDDSGAFPGLGVSYFQALRRAKHDRERFRRDLAFLSGCGFNYIRVLSMVGGHESWKGLEIAPVAFRRRNGDAIDAWPDYWGQLGEMIDIAHEAGLRTQLTVFADAREIMPDKQARLEHLRRVLEIVKGREHKVLMIEVANEAWQNGFPGRQGIADLREFGHWIKERTNVLVALSSTDGGTNDSLRAMYAGSAADVATEHFSRDIRSLEGGWLPVRDAWRVKSATDLPPVSSNEPIGPGASVAAERDPVKLVSAAACAWMSGLPMYVFHSAAGVRGDQPFEEMPGIGGFRHLVDLLPGDIANWPNTDGKGPEAPFISFAGGRPDMWWTDLDNAGNTSDGAIRHFAASKDGRFYTLAIGIRPDGVTLEARHAMTIDVIDLLTGQTIRHTKLDAGRRFTLDAGPGARLIRGRHLTAAEAAAGVGAPDGRR